MKNITWLHKLLITVLFLFSSSVMAGSLPSVPHTYSEGTAAKASEVNENFEAIRAEVHDNALDVSANKVKTDSNTSKISTNTGNISSNSTEISALISLVASLEAQLEAALKSNRKVAILASDSREDKEDVLSKIISRGSFGFVDVINIGLVAPTLEKLQTYDAVLVWKNFSLQDSVGLGNVLADYIDQGGGVVLTVFSSGLSVINGRFAADNYYVMTPSNNASGVQQQLVKTIPDHPLLTNVVSFDGGSSSYHINSSTVEAGGTIVATWTGGNVLIATKDFAGTRRVDLNFYLPSSDVRADFWDVTTDGIILMVNALLYVMGVI